MATREEVHRIIDELPENEIHAARRFLEYLRSLGDPVLRALAEAPEDDEPETEEERAAVAKARQEIAANKIVSAAEVWDDIS